MTIEEFKLTLSDSEIGSPGTQVVLLFNEYSGPTYRVDAAAIRITEDNLQQLQQATDLILNVPSTGELINIPVSDSIVPLRTVDKSIAFSYYVYYILQELQRPLIQAPTTGSSGYESYTTQLVLQPGSFETNYEFSDYNPLTGNAIESRQSDYIFNSDRVQSTINPTNLGGILNKTATLAPVQDSNYTNTGWSNARYRGTKLSAANNLGVDPSLQGSFFEAAIFNSDADDAEIIGLASYGNTVFNEYFFTGIGEIPQYIREDIDWTYLPNFGYQTNYFWSSYNITVASNGYTKKDLKVGDLLSIQNPANVLPLYASESLIRMLPPVAVNSSATYPYNSYTDISILSRRANITIEDRYNGSPSLLTYYSYGGATPAVTRISPMKIYSTDGTAIRGVQKSKLIIKGRTTEVLYLDKYGRVIGGTAPVEI